MNSGYLILGLGVIGIVAGAGLYLTGLHHTIGLGGVGLGVLLVVVGLFVARGEMKRAPPSGTPT